MTEPIAAIGSRDNDIQDDFIAMERGGSGCPHVPCSNLPFGDNLSCTGNSYQLPSPLHFTGKPRDAATGLDFFGARYYNSSLGRWMTPDWSAQAEPVPYAQLDNPQSLNLYSYVLNNPVSSVDPDGHYNTGCKGSDISKCSKDIQSFEANRQRDLHSKDARVRAAAAAYGNFNDGNNVDLKFNPNAKDGHAQQESRHGRATNRVLVTMPGMGNGVTAGSAGIVAHEGSHAQDIQAAISGATTLTRYQSEMKAYETQAAVLNDFYPLGSTTVGSFQERGISIFLMQPFDRFSEAVNEDEIRQFLATDPNYFLSEKNQGGPEGVQP